MNIDVSALRLEGAKAVILCVDDEENSLTLRKLVLQRAGYEVITATSGPAALDILKSRTVHLVLSDQLMPGQTGTELALQVKNSWPNLPIILMSGVNEIPADAAIADLFISKVEGPVNMCQKIEAILSQYYSC